MGASKHSRARTASLSSSILPAKRIRHDPARCRRLTVPHRGRGGEGDFDRLDDLAQFCVAELGERGLAGAVTEAKLSGGGREKSWDVAWRMDEKPRLAISLKSLLKNLGGTVPNRVDDLMGEVTNVQMYSPEIVTGYIMLFNVAEDSYSPRHQSTWAKLLKSRITRLSGRRPPSWSIGMIEASLFLEVDFSEGPKLVSGPDDVAPFFDRLVRQVRHRNPILERRS